MYRILEKKLLASNIYLMKVEAPRIARACLPGQFVIVKDNERGERIPLTICDYDAQEGSVTIVFQTVGSSTYQMALLNEGDAFQDFVGPLGNPSDLTKEPLEELQKENILFVGGGVGTAPVYPQVKWLCEQGIKCDVIIGAKTKDQLILVEEMQQVAGSVYIATDDGTEGFHGMVTGKLQQLVEEEGKHYSRTVVIGPMPMMRACCQLTKKLGIPTIVSINTIMVDGTGMCGACRVSVGGKVKFACVDGPEFDGHQLDFDEAMRRQGMYRTEEGIARQRELDREQGIQQSCGCGCGGDK